MPCPHPYGLKVQDRCYFCLKLAAANGHRSKLTPEQLAFVGFVDTPRPAHRSTLDHVLSHLDQRLDELAARRDIAPGWFKLAAKILEED